MAPPALEIPRSELDTFAENPSEASSSCWKDDPQRTYIARLILAIEESLQRLGVDIDSDESIQRIESMSILIHESMSISSRNYHSVQHVFDISKALTNPIAILAAMFHDCIYYHIDGGLSEIQAAKLQGVLLDETGDSALRIHPDAENDELLRMIIQVYGLKAGQEITAMMGLNEFLSAVICIRELEHFLPIPKLVQLACCIELTIPFRPTDPTTGNGPPGRLYERLVHVNQAFNLNMTDTEMVQSVQNAVLLANSDVGNFGTEDVFWFLDNTWSLLPESNEALRHDFLYTVKEFQFAVFKMNGFFNFIKSDVVFMQFRGVPTEEGMAKLVLNSNRNLEVGRKYLASKLLSTSFLAAIAQLTGGDAPISLFMGDLPSRNRISRRLEDSLPPPPAEVDHCDPVVFEILAFGRRRETSFDVKQSPLAAYMYSVLGDAEVGKIVSDMTLYPMTDDVAKALLARLPREPVLRIATNIAKVAPSRKDLILRLVEDLPGTVGE